MAQKYKIIALFGKSSAGKDTIQKWLVQHMDNAHEIISCTTRPPRDYENDGIDYHFLSIDKFGEKVLNHTMLEATSFRDWFYGTPIESLDKDKINIGVFNIEGIKCLVEDNRLEVYPVLIDAPDKVRLLRSLNREEKPDCLEICRRFLADEKDFSEIDDLPFNFRGYININQTHHIDLMIALEKDINR